MEMQTITPLKSLETHPELSRYPHTIQPFMETAPREVLETGEERQRMSLLSPTDIFHQCTANIIGEAKIFTR